MNSQIQNLIEISKEVVGEFESATPKTEVWFAKNNLNSFINIIETEPNEIGIQKAVHYLQHKIVDQFDWNAEHTKKLSALCERAAAIEKRIKKST